MDPAHRLRSRAALIAGVPIAVLVGAFVGNPRGWALSAGDARFKKRCMDKLIQLCGFDCTVMIISHGKNGLGGRTVRGSVLLPMPTGADELLNATTALPGAPPHFVTRVPTDVAAATGGAFDDLVAYMTPNHLLQPLLDDKTLKGVCQAYCAVPGPGCVAAAVPVGNPAPTCP